MINIDQNFLDELRDKIDLLEYAESKGFEFKRSGKDYFTHCPLHTDNTPSLAISEDDDGLHRNFYCHSCKQGGGIIKWLVVIEQISFNDAVKKASELADMDMSKMCQSPTVIMLRNQSREQKKIINRKDIQHTFLPESTLDNYSIERVPEWEAEGISQETIREFDIRIDKGGNRIIYPVRDSDGNLINIKGRTRYQNYKKMRIAKYKNYYPVNGLDYFQNLDRAKPYILKADEIIIFESIKSVMKCYDWGIKNVVSAETHALTDGQIKEILHLGCSNVVVAFDKDVEFYSAKEREMRRQMNKLKIFSNLYYIYDQTNTLGEKDSPADMGEENWEFLYKNRRRWR